MSQTGPSDWGDTRSNILTRLCSGGRTAPELARELGVSANAVRAQLAQLREEGLVSYRLRRGSVGKPAHVYGLTAAGSVRLSSAYLPLLAALLEAVAERSDGSELEELLRVVGRRLARTRPRAHTGTAAARVTAAHSLLTSLGAACRVVRENGEISILGDCCPLRALVPDHPLVCRAVEAMLEEHTGLTVREDCGKGDPPECRFLFSPVGERGVA